MTHYAVQPVTVLFNAHNNVTGVFVGSPRDYAHAKGYDIEWGNEGGTFYRRGERWPCKPAAYFIQTRQVGV